MSYALLGWQQAMLSSRAACGGKGWNLARLHHYGFIIPHGGVITAPLYHTLIATNTIQNLIAQVEKLSDHALLDAAHPLLAELQATIIRTALPDRFTQNLSEFLAQQSLLSAFVSVRSSATLEDGDITSFAGMHDTTLNIQGQAAIERAILQCFASLWSNRTISYRRKMQIADTDIACAVVVMAMAKAKSAGVAFSCDPLTGRRDVITINANFGLGESVVSGKIEPDQYRVNRFSKQILDQHVGSKQQSCQPKTGGGIEWLTAHHQSACLNTYQIKTLAQLCDRVFHALGQGEQHQDIEWAFDGEQFILLQARPVTALPNITCAEISNQPEIWSNGNFRDAAPMVLSRLTAEFCDHHINNILQRNFDGFYSIDPALRFARQFGGRFYLNASLMQWLWFDAVDFPTDKTNISIGGHQTVIHIEEKYQKGLGKKLIRLLRGLKFFRMLNDYRKRADVIISTEIEFAEHYRKLDYTALTDQDLLDTLQLLDAHLAEFDRAFIMLTAQSGALFMLIQTLEKYCGEHSYALANGLLAGRANITSADHGYQLQDLAQQLKNDPQALPVILNRAFLARDWQTLLPEHSPFKQAFANYLAQYGHRAVYEIDLSRPRWREDPDYLFDCIKSYLSRPETRPKIAPSYQQQTWIEVKQRTPRYLHGYINSLVNRTARGAALKELSKSTFIRLLEPMRLTVLEIGQRLIQRKVIDAVEDVFHCAFCELQAMLRNEWDGHAFKILLAERKATKLHQEQLLAPDIIIGDTPQHITAPSPKNSKGLRGIGAAAGVASGTARLIKTPEAGIHLQQGDVLVAPSTDPAWTPLFLNAAAIVMETGGYLSHGSIVAREYGIPAVVNIAGVFSALQDGDSLRVDGNQGIVEVNA